LVRQKDVVDLSLNVISVDYVVQTTTRRISKPGFESLLSRLVEVQPMLAYAAADEQRLEPMSLHLDRLADSRVTTQSPTFASIQVSGRRARPLRASRRRRRERARVAAF
jgi:hypothetical protein